LASVAFPAWCLGHDPSAQILCVSYAQVLADKLSRDCRRIIASDWYQRLFPTRLSPHAGIYHLYRELYEAQQAGPTQTAKLPPLSTLLPILRRW
jgi:hypothetical protein